jgi:hypothetical protein
MDEDCPVYDNSIVYKPKLNLKGNDYLIKCPVCNADVIARFLKRHLRKAHNIYAK